MYADARKIHLIEQVLKVNDDAVLKALEEVLDKGLPVKKQTDWSKIAGSITNEEADEMLRVINEEFGRVNPDGWK